MISERQLKKYCISDGKDIENYEEAISDNTQTWEIHHREGLKYSMEYLKEKKLYYGRPAKELIFMTQSEHQKIHKKGKKRKPFTDEWRENIGVAMSKSLKGIPKTAEHRAALSKSKKGNKNVKGRHWYNNGIENKRAFTCPDGFVKGRLI